MKTGTAHPPIMHAKDSTWAKQDVGASQAIEKHGTFYLYSVTLHPGIVEFKQHWYLFLHNATLAIGDLNGAIGRRAVTVEHLQYNADGTMRPVRQTGAGVSIPAASR
ncbi:hypothetical protein NRY95_13710 [Xanthomonas campestris pv. phormiicola]|nr:hypothetical protein [Xanthomonas campestris pv. phormiicola]UYC14790.1 hypothetical protein NRY95_13710 [Xanthomonas campestris pv. phormiicola]